LEAKHSTDIPQEAEAAASSLSLALAMFFLFLAGILRADLACFLLRAKARSSSSAGIFISSGLSCAGKASDFVGVLGPRGLTELEVCGRCI
jgi:hypothetical protein